MNINAYARKHLKIVTRGQDHCCTTSEAQTNFWKDINGTATLIQILF